MVRPVAGELIKSRCDVVMRGGRNPLLVDFTSSMAELSGVLLSELMPTWANKPALIITSANNRVNLLFIVKVLVVNNVTFYL